MKPCCHLANDAGECAFVNCPITHAFSGWVSKTRNCEYHEGPGILQATETGLRALEVIFRKVDDLKKDLGELGIDVEVTISGLSGKLPGSGVVVIALVLDDIEALKTLELQRKDPALEGVRALIAHTIEGLKELELQRKDPALEGVRALIDHTIEVLKELEELQEVP